MLSDKFRFFAYFRGLSAWLFAKFIFSFWGSVIFRHYFGSLCYKKMQKVHNFGKNGRFLHFLVTFLFKLRIFSLPILNI